MEKKKIIYLGESKYSDINTDSDSNIVDVEHAVTTSSGEYVLPSQLQDGIKRSSQMTEPRDIRIKDDYGEEWDACSTEPGNGIDSIGGPDQLFTDIPDDIESLKREVEEWKKRNKKISGDEK